MNHPAVLSQGAVRGDFTQNDDPSTLTTPFIPATLAGLGQAHLTENTSSIGNAVRRTVQVGVGKTKTQRAMANFTTPGMRNRAAVLNMVGPVGSEKTNDR